MALNFPNSPIDGQSYFDASSGNRYIYDSANTIWKYAANNALAGSANSQILFNNEGAIDGSDALVFEANTLYPQEIVVTQNATATYYFGNGAFLTGITTSVDLTPANNWANTLSTTDRAIANAAANSANAYTVTVGAASNTWANATFYTAANGAIAFTAANGAYINANNAANSANAYTVTIGAAANTFATSQDNNVRAFANSTANSANAYAVTVGAASNTWANATFYTAANGAIAFTQANGAYINANNAANSANLVANSTYVKLTATSQTISGDLSITGNLILLGNATSIVSNNLVVGDSLIYLASNNYTGTDLLDIGFIANYGNATAANVHTGLVRDATTKQYYLFSGLDIELQGNNTAFIPYANNMVNAALNADLITSNLTLGGANAITWINSLYAYSNGTANSANAYTVTIGAASNTWANATFYTAANGAIAFTAANGAYINANNAANSANAYTVTVGAASNTYANASFYTIANGAAAFSQANGAYINANNAANSANAYTVTVGAAANTWANTKLANTSGVTFNGSLYFTTGNVGIGTSAPAANLDVVGSVSTSKANILSQTLTFVASPSTTAWDTSLGQIATLTLTGNAILAAPTNLRVGTYILHVIQDGVGGRTLDVTNAVFKWPGGVDPVATTTASARDVYTFVSDGTNMYGSYIQNVK